MTAERFEQTIRARWRARDDDSGFTLVFVAIFLVAMLVFVALVIDGGNGVSTRRKMQNAADAGAMAGTLALRKAQLAGSTTGEGDVATIVANIIADNGASAPGNGTELCQVVRADAITVVGPCSNSAHVLNPNAAGVLVNVESEKATFFGAVAGQPRQTVRTKAAATVQVVTTGTAPWIVCGWGESNGGPGWDLLGPDNTNVPHDADNLQDFIHTTAVTKYGWDSAANAPLAGTQPLVVQENVGPHEADTTGCGAGRAMNGQGDGDAPVVQQGETLVFEGQPGNADNIVLPPNWSAQQIVGGTTCAFDNTPQVHELGDTPQEGCDILLPISVLNERNGSHIEAHIVAFAAFRIYEGSGNQKVLGYYRGPSMTTTGFTSSEQCTTTSPACAVKLRI